MAPAHDLDRALLDYLDQFGTVTMEQLIQRFHDHTFNQVFNAIDRLSREDAICLVRQTSFDYILSLRPAALRPVPSTTGRREAAGRAAG